MVGDPLPLFTNKKTKQNKINFLIYQLFPITVNGDHKFFTPPKSKKRRSNLPIFSYTYFSQVDA